MHDVEVCATELKDPDFQTCLTHGFFPASPESNVKLLINVKCISVLDVQRTVTFTADDFKAIL